MTMSEEKIWYAVIQNKAEGPHSQFEIQQMIDGGKLSFTDFIFKPGMATWTPIGDVKEFERRDIAATESGKTEIESPLPEDDREGWVVLAKHINAEGKQTLVQQGPLTGEQVREKLARDEIKYDDHVWQKGFSDWKKIGTLDVFDRRRPQNFEKQPKPNFSQDKTVTGVEVKPEVKSETTVEANSKPESKKGKFIIAAAAAALGMLVVYFGLDAYKQTLIKAPEKNQDKKTLTSTKIIPQLKVASIKSNTQQKPQLVFETNLKEGSKIQVELEADLGDILNYPRLNIKKELTVVEGQLPILDLSSEDLPQGGYKVKATAQGLYTQTNVKVGVHDQVLVKKLEDHKAALLSQGAKERGLLASAISLFQNSQNKLQKIQVAQKKQKNQKATQQALVAWRKEFSSKVAAHSWYEKLNSKNIIYPQAHGKYVIAKAKLTDLSQELSKKQQGRSIASQGQQIEEAKKAIAELQTSFRSLK